MVQFCSTDHDFLWKLMGFLWTSENPEAKGNVGTSSASCYFYPSSLDMFRWF